MSNPTDTHHAQTNQYRDAGNLDARAELHRRYSTNSYGLHRWVFDHLDLPASAHVLELGSGPGWLWSSNLERIPPGWEITLTDFSPGMVKQARQNLMRGGRMFGFRVVDAQAIPYNDGHFDAVIANHMLYHVPDRPRALREIARVLRPGGALYATTVGLNQTREMYDLIGDFIGHPVTGPSIARDFALQNGAAQLEAVFASVARVDYEDGLHVTDAEPLVAYICSLADFMDITAIIENRAAFSAFIAARMAEDGGAIHITKESGLFIAHKAG
ncbi:MAG: class I SAM-dependent methyltransferase [Anaerolineae bacterium]|nr:class I SAM-dependent methyltransferase [Anaerolineae bacterium]